LQLLPLIARLTQVGLARTIFVAGVFPYMQPRIVCVRFWPTLHTGDRCVYGTFNTQVKRSVPRILGGPHFIVGPVAWPTILLRLLCKEYCRLLLKPIHSEWSWQEPRHTSYSTVCCMYVDSSAKNCRTHTMHMFACMVLAQTRKGHSSLDLEPALVKGDWEKRFWLAWGIWLYITSTEAKVPVRPVSLPK
jgi:hypothetical protein